MNRPPLFKPADIPYEPVPKPRAPRNLIKRPLQLPPMVNIRGDRPDEEPPR